MRCFEAALQCKGARLKYDAEAAASSDVIAVEAYNHFGISLTEQMLQLDNNPDQSTAKKMYTKKWYGESFATAVSHENLGYILMITSQYEDAAENFKQAQCIFQKLGLEQDAEKQNGFLETVAGCMESGDTGGGWELHSIDEFDNLTLNE